MARRIPLTPTALCAVALACGCGGSSDERAASPARQGASGSESSAGGGESPPREDGGASSSGSVSSGGRPAGDAPGGVSESPSGGGISPGRGGSSPGRGSSGCGAEEPLESGRFTIDIDGIEREYVLDVPDSYDGNHPYRLIFAWHWADAYAQDVVTGEPGPYGGLGPYYGLKALADESAIFVSPEGIEEAWFNEDDTDIDFLRGMLERFNEGLCIDQDRIFTTGFSFGGMMSVAVGCEMGDVFRALAPMAGATTSGCNEAKDDPIAFLGIHGSSDVNIDLELGYQPRDIFLRRNHCEPSTVATDPSPCVAYEGCDEGEPVHWCEFDGDHTQWDGAPRAIWDFFSQF